VDPVKASIRAKLDQLQERFEELSGLLSDPEVIGNQSRFASLSKEYARLEPIVDEYRRYNEMLTQLRNAEEMRRDDDPEIRSMAEEEIRAVQAQLAEQERKLQVLLLPSDPNDERNIFLEEIGRASCRERVEIWRAAVAGERKKRRGESGGK